MIKILLIIWIIIKRFLGKLSCNIGLVKNELDFIASLSDDKTYSEVVKHSIVYKQDFIDSQCDSITALNNKYDDCDGYNRIAQVYYHLKGYESYLVSYWASPFIMSHATAIIKKDGLWFSRDYGVESKNGYFSFENCLDQIARTYGATVKAYAIQDIQWRIINVNKITKSYK